MLWGEDLFVSGDSMGERLDFLDSRQTEKLFLFVFLCTERRQCYQQQIHAKTLSVCDSA